jgi:hypothetical protein
MIASGLQVVHHIAKGISKRMVGGPDAWVLRPLELRLKPAEGLEDRLESRDEGG